MSVKILDKPEAVPARPSSDTKYGRTKYPFGELELPDPKTGRGRPMLVEGEKEARNALIRMRAYTREHGARFVTEQETDRHGVVIKVKIWRIA